MDQALLSPNLHAPAECSYEYNEFSRALHEFCTEAHKLIKERTEESASRLVKHSGAVLDALYALARNDAERAVFPNTEKNCSLYCGYLQFAIAVLQSKTPSPPKERAYAATLTSHSTLTATLVTRGVAVFDKQRTLEEAIALRVRGVLYR